MDLYHIIPGPIMLALLMASLVWVCLLFSSTDSMLPQRGTGLKILSIILLLAVMAPNFFTNWVNWPMTVESSRSAHDVAVTFTIYTTKDNCEVIEQLLQSYTEVPKATYSVKGCG